MPPWYVALLYLSNTTAFLRRLHFCLNERCNKCGGSIPWILEVIFEFEKLGFDPIAGISFQNQMERIIQEPNVHLKGVALPPQVKKAIIESEATSTVGAYLKRSEEYELRSADPVELAKTWLEAIRLKQKEGDRRKAVDLVKLARIELSGHLEEFVPDDLSYLLEGEKDASSLQESKEEVVERFLDLLDTLLPSADPECSDEKVGFTLSPKKFAVCQ